jgi:menaquinone-specific isochorismate synthase
MLCQSPFNRLDPSQDCKNLYQFLEFCKQRSVAEYQPKLASFALEIPGLDPLVVLDDLAEPNQMHFYFENRDQQQAVAALDAAVSQQLGGADRFLEAQCFVQDCFTQLLSAEAVSLPTWVKPYCFNSFTFFDHNRDPKAPFSPATVFLPKWQIIRRQARSFVVVNWLIDWQSSLTEITQTIWQQLQKIRLSQAVDFHCLAHLSSGLSRWDMLDTNQFQTAVSSALRSIQNRAYKKLVLAHAVDVCADQPFHGARSLHQLRQLHPDCAVFSVGNGQGQSFIGASPERLLSLHQGQLITDALAGSAPRGQTVTDDACLAQRLLQNDKERREHQLVVEFIAQQLLDLGLVPAYAKTPSLLQLSNIQHLHTPIQAAAQLHPLQILAALHPTPAVAGMPRQTACAEILHYEQFDRSLYASPLGWIDAQGNAEFVVGIRSALLDGQRARLYAGAGIVAGSDPDREFAEVKLKLQALLRGLS